MPSSAQPTVASPVFGVHRSLNAANGTNTGVNAEDAEAAAVKFALKQPLDSGMDPPPLQEYDADGCAPLASDTWYSGYGNPLTRKDRTSPPAPPAAQRLMSGKAPSAAAFKNPGEAPTMDTAGRGTTVTTPERTPPPSPSASTVQFPHDWLPITGSTRAVNGNVVPVALSKVTNGISRPRAQGRRTRRRRMVVVEADFFVANCTSLNLNCFF